MDRSRRLAESLDHASETLTSSEHMLANLRSMRRAPEGRDPLPRQYPVDPRSHNRHPSTGYAPSTRFEEPQPSRRTVGRDDLPRRSQPVLEDDFSFSDGARGFPAVRVHEDSIASSDAGTEDSLYNTNHRVVQLLSTTAAQNRESQKLIEVLKKENVRLSSELESFRSKVGGADRDKTHAQEGLQAALQRNERLHRELDDERRKNMEMEAIKADCATLKSALAQARDENSDLRDQIGDANARTAEGEARHRAAAERKAEMDAKIMQLEATVRAKTDEAETARREVHIVEESYRRQLNSMESRYMHAPPAPPPITIERADRHTIAELASEQARNTALQTQVATLQTQIASLSGTNAALNAQHSEFQQEIESMRRKIKQSKHHSEMEEQSQIRELESRLRDNEERWTDKYKQLEYHYNEAQNRVIEIENEMEVFHKTSTKHGSELTSMEKDLSSLAADLEAFCEELHETSSGPNSFAPVSSRDIFVRLNHYLTFIQTRVRQLHRDKAKLKEELKALHVDKSYLSTELQSKNDQIRRLSSLYQEEKAILLSRLDEQQRVDAERRRGASYPVKLNVDNPLKSSVLNERSRHEHHTSTRFEEDARSHRTNGPPPPPSSSSRHSEPAPTHHHTSKSLIAEEARQTLKETQSRVKSAQDDAAAELKAMRQEKTRIDTDLERLKTDFATKESRSRTRK